MVESNLTSRIISSAIEVHKALGPGLLESVYEICLARELESQGLNIQRQAELPLRYKDLKFDTGFRLDLFIENRVIVEVKSVEALNDIHKAQVLTYLKLTRCRIGLLINFNVKRLKQGIKRLIY